MRYTVEIDNDGTTRWYKEGTAILHRVGGPAVEYKNGNKIWCFNGERHNLDGPAVITDDYKQWIVCNIILEEEKFNQLFGNPKDVSLVKNLMKANAYGHIENSNGHTIYFLNGKVVTQAHYFDNVRITYNS